MQMVAALNRCIFDPKVKQNLKYSDDIWLVDLFGQAESEKYNPF